MLEPEMEAFLLRLVPGLEQAWQGATQEEIAEIAEIAGQELPPFYRWFLARMGRSAGPLRQPLAAYSVRTVLSAYDNGEVDLEPPLLLIARTDDPIMPMELYYDLGRRVRDDAFVVSSVGHELTNDAETLRERLAWTLLIKLRINPSPQRCTGRFKASGGDVAEHLAPVLAGLGFVSSVSTGPYCGVYERSDVALACIVDAEPENRDLLIFDVGGPSAAVLRRLLGEIAAQTDIEVNVTGWDPPLPK